MQPGRSGTWCNRGDHVSGGTLRIGNNIATRLCDLGALIVRIARELPSEPALRHIAPQLSRAGTSAGANYEEARAAESRADFIHKISIAAKEMREALYWIRLVPATATISPPVMEHALKEATELCDPPASARTARKNSG